MIIFNPFLNFPYLWVKYHLPMLQSLVPPPLELLVLCCVVIVSGSRADPYVRMMVWHLPINVSRPCTVFRTGVYHGIMSHVFTSHNNFWKHFHKICNLAQTITATTSIFKQFQQKRVWRKRTNQNKTGLRSEVTRQGLALNIFLVKTEF